MKRLVLVAVILGVSAVIPLLLGRWISQAAEQRGESSAARFWNRVAAFAPVTTAGLVAYQLAYIPGLAGLQFSMHGSGPGASGLTVSVLGMLRVGVLLAGLLATLILLWRVNRRGSEEGAPPTPRTRRASLATALGFSAVLLVLMLTP